MQRLAYVIRPSRVVRKSSLFVDPKNSETQQTRRSAPHSSNTGAQA